MTDPVGSPFVDDWPNPNDRDRYRLHAREVYVGLRDDRRAAFEGHVGYGKWLIGSLLALHSGAIFAIMNLRATVDAAALSILLSASGCNVGGILRILLAGFFAWLNFQLAERLYAGWATPAMLYRNDKWPSQPGGKTNPIGATMYLAAMFGILSAVLLAMSASIVLNGLGAVIAGK